MSVAYLVLCYDVVADPRRNRLHRRLKGFLQPVQKSVFEGPVPRRRLDALRRLVRDTIDPDQDSVRIYVVPPEATRHIEHFGITPVLPVEPEDVIV